MTIARAKKLITKWVQKWYPLIGDMRLEANIDWSSSPDTRSGCQVVERYLYCDLQFSPSRVIAVHTNQETGKFDAAEMEKEVVHECAHTIPWRVAQRLVEAGVPEREAERLEEQVTTMIERAVWNAYQLGLKTEVWKE
jgi:hypothetical protein